LQVIRPEYVGVDPVDRFVYKPGAIVQCDLWFPETPIAVGGGQERILPVLVMVLGYSRFITAVMIPSRRGGDILSGMWELISQLGRVPKTLVWDRESAIGGTGKVTTVAAAFAGTLATRIQLAPPRDPEYKGVVERANGYLETSFLPGRRFTSPTDFNIQLQDWLTRANTRTVRAIGGRPADLLTTDVQAMIELPPVIPSIGLTHRIRLARDYYVRIDAADYSIDPRVIGRFVDVSASPTTVTARCDGQIVARHDRSWATPRRHRSRSRRYRGATAPRIRIRAGAPHSSGHPSAHRRPYRRITCATSLRRLVRRRLRLHPNNSEDHVMTSTATRKKAEDHATAAAALPADGLPSQMAYLTRVLKTPTIGRVWEELADHARDENWSHEEYLATVLQRQLADRESAGTTMRIRTAHFPAVKTLEDFNLDHLPSLRRDVLAHLATGMFVPKAENVILLGPPGYRQKRISRSDSESKPPTPDIPSCSTPHRTGFHG
jgi:hypothetical protein